MRASRRPVCAFVIFLMISMLAGCGGDCSGKKSKSGITEALIALWFATSGGIKTGEEVLFNASDFFDTGTLTDPLFAKYEWEINDHTTPPVEGRSTTHVFTSPGTYTVTLKVTQGVLTDGGEHPDQQWDDTYDFPADTTRTFEKTVTVGGDSPLLPPLVSAAPLLDLPLDDSISDRSAGNRAVEWGNGTGTFMPGIKGKALDVSGGTYLRVKDPSSWLGGLGEFTISFWARKKDTTKDRNYFFSMAGSSGLVLSYYIYNNATAPTDCEYRMRLRTSSGTVIPGVATRDVYEDTLWHHYAFTYSASEGRARLYLDGREAAASSCSGTMEAPTGDLLVGFESASGAFNGYIDEVKIYGKALTARDLSVGFEIWHADIHARSAQYLYVQVPEQVTIDPSNRLRVTLSGGALGFFGMTLADKAALQQEEKILLNNSTLNGSQGDYVLTAQLLSSSGSLIYSTSEKFKKTYNGAPVVGIDENNSLRVNGELFFPVTPWGLNNDDIAPWAGAGYINTLFGQGFWGSGSHAPAYTIDGYREYLDLGVASNVMTIGPSTHWKGQGTQTRYFFQKSSDPKGIMDYATALSGHPGQLMWGWWDEPELNDISAPVLRSWTYITHAYDGQHPVLVNFMGHPYTYVNGTGSWWYINRHDYTYGYSKKIFGKRKQPSDIVGFDYYPLDAVRADSTDTMHRLTTALDTMRLENFDLLPVMSCVETADPGNGGDTPWTPSAEQLHMMNWLNVVHEVKGIVWFHYFGGTPAANYEEMARFTRQITELAPAVLGPRISRSVTVDCGGQTGRIDTMVREYNGTLYLFAVRVSEAAYQASSATTPPPPAQNYTLDNVTLTLGDGIRSQEAAVYEEGRTVTVSGGRITDRFAPFAVHIYCIGE